MKTYLAALGLVAMVGAAAPAFARDFPATPLSPAAPTNLPGEKLIPGLPEAVAVFNGVTSPIIQPILVPTATAAAAPEPATVHHRHHHRHLALRHHRAHHVG